MLHRFALLYKNQIDTGKHWIHIQLDEFLILYVFIYQIWFLFAAIVQMETNIGTCVSSWKNR